MVPGLLPMMLEGQSFIDAQDELSVLEFMEKCVLVTVEAPWWQPNLLQLIAIHCSDPHGLQVWDASPYQRRDFHCDGEGIGLLGSG